MSTSGMELITTGENAAMPAFDAGSTEALPLDGAIGKRHESSKIDTAGSETEKIHYVCFHRNRNWCY